MGAGSIFNSRSYQAEIMDDMSLAGEEMEQTLRELEVINKWLGGDYVTIQGIAKVWKEKAVKNQEAALTVADLGCGGGDMLRKISKWAKGKGIKIALTGVDLNDFIIQYATKNTKADPAISYLQSDIFSDEFKKRPFDIVTCTLFTHHFTDEELIGLFVQLAKQTRLSIVINDIHRHWFAYYSIWWLTAWFSKSYMVRNDAKLSVLRAFKKKELKNILFKAGLHNYTIKWMWAFRWQVLIYP